MPRYLVDWGSWAQGRELRVSAKDTSDALIKAGELAKQENLPGEAVQVHKLEGSKPYGKVVWDYVNGSKIYDQ